MTSSNIISKKRSLSVSIDTLFKRQAKNSTGVRPSTSGVLVTSASDEWEDVEVEGDVLSSSSESEGDVEDEEVYGGGTSRPTAHHNVGNYDSHVKYPGPVDLAQSKLDTPKQPCLQSYPVTTSNKSSRHFRSEWFKKYPWLEYSILSNATFCFCCRMFGMSNDLPLQSQSVFTSTGFSNWKKATEKDAGFKQHENSSSHKSCMIAWDSFSKVKIQEGSTSVMCQISDSHRELVRENRFYIATLAEILLLTAVQKVGQRGHDEKEESLNRGNFLEVLNVIGNHDPRIQKKIENLPKNAKYTHHTIQNELVDIMATLVLETISKEVSDAGLFAVMADETKDVSKQEQLSIVVRYYKEGSLHERFLGYHPCESLDAKSLCAYITTTLAKCNIDKHTCIAQTYDGASVMSGSAKGVQEIFAQQVPQAVYVHCFNHRLNLVIVDVCKGNDSVSRFIAQLQRLYVFVSRSTVHPVFVALQKEVGSRVVELKRLSETRWVCQIAACDAVKSTFSVLILLLHRISVESSTMKGNEARGILEQIDFEFLFCLYLFSDVLRDLKLISDYLQKSDCDMAHACLLVDSLVDTFEQMRSEPGKFNSLMTKVKLIAEENSIELSENRNSRTRQLPKRFASFATELQTSESEIPRSDDDFRIKIFNSVLDHMITELKSRFTNNSDVLNGISAINPTSDNFLKFNKLKPLAEHYRCDMESIEAEVKLFPLVLKRIETENNAKVDSIVKLATVLNKYKMSFNELYKLAVIAVTIPPSSAGCERSFSSLRQIKSYLRNNMGNTRLSNLAVLAIEKSLAKSLDLNQVVDRFAVSHNNRRIQLV